MLAFLSLELENWILPWRYLRLPGYVASERLNMRQIDHLGVSSLRMGWFLVILRDFLVYDSILLLRGIHCAERIRVEIVWRCYHSCVAKRLKSRCASSILVAKILPITIRQLLCKHRQPLLKLLSNPLPHLLISLSLRWHLARWSRVAVVVHPETLLLNLNLNF
jgi:hypothetical protein